MQTPPGGAGASSVPAAHAQHLGHAVYDYLRRSAYKAVGGRSRRLGDHPVREQLTTAVSSMTAQV